MTIRDAFIEFLEASPDTPGSYNNPDGCFMQQFGQSLHPNEVVKGGTDGFLFGEYPSTIVNVINTEDNDYCNLIYAETFGQAAHNLRTEAFNQMINTDAAKQQSKEQE